MTLTGPVTPSGLQQPNSSKLKENPGEINKGDGIAWYADGDPTVWVEYNPDIAYGFGGAKVTRNHSFAVKDVFGIIQEVINDFLDSAEQNLRIRVYAQTGTTSADQMDLLLEQVKMLAGVVERLLDQAANNPGDMKLQEHIRKLRIEISKKGCWSNV